MCSTSIDRASRIELFALAELIFRAGVGCADYHADGSSANFPEPLMGTSRPLAIVTSASTGIGYELAKTAAKNGYDS
jgi:hypothetical protein